MILTVETNVSKELFVRSNADDLIDYVSWELSNQIAHEVNKVTEVETEFNKDNFSHTFSKRVFVIPPKDVTRFLDVLKGLPYEKTRLKLTGEFYHLITGEEINKEGYDVKRHSTGKVPGVWGELLLSARRLFHLS